MNKNFKNTENKNCFTKDEGKKEKDMAKKSLELIAKASHTVESLAVNSEQAQKQKESVAKIIEISSKISSLDFGQSSTRTLDADSCVLTSMSVVAT